MANTVVIDGLPKMDPERKAEWVAALRSGEYKQGYEWLNQRGNMCCLGVACDLHNNSTGNQAWSDAIDYEKTLGVVRYEGQSSYPPEDVLAWLGFELADLRTQDVAQQELAVKLNMPVTNTGMVHYVLANMNDSMAWSFDQIADFIETNF